MYGSYSSHNYIWNGRVGLIPEQLSNLSPKEAFAPKVCQLSISTSFQPKLLLQRIQAAVNPEETHHKEFPKATTERSGTRRLESNSRISKQTQNDAETTTSDPDREATSPAKRSHQSPPSIIVTDARLQTAAGNITQRSDQHRSM
jgi:hypothetical protein